MADRVQGYARRVGGVLGVAVLLLATAGLRAQAPPEGGQPAGPAAGKTTRPGAASKGRAPAKGLSRKRATTAAPKEEPAPAADDGTLKFTRDIAPVLVGNCTRCHDAKASNRVKNFNLSSFAALMKGGDSGPVIVPGKPDESLIIQRVTGDGVPKMPPGQTKLADETIAKLEEWIKAGARLEEGVSETADLKTIAARPDDLRRQRLSRLKPDQVDQAVEEAGRTRWSKATSSAPDVTRGTSFLLFSKLPEAQAKSLLKTLDGEANILRTALGPDLSKVLAGPEKISLYVFPDPNAYVEFARGVENRNVDANAAQAGEAHANFGIEQPYLVAFAPQAGAAADTPASATPAKKSVRSPRRGRTETARPAGPERSLAGLLTEQLVTGVCMQAGKAPPWLCLGLAAHMAAQVEPRSPYYQRLRADLANLAGQQWDPNRARNLLNEGDENQHRAAGLGLIDFLSASNPNIVGPIVRQLLVDGPGQFDNDLKQGLGLQNVDQFYNAWGAWIMQSYGGR
jgi:hypothetical protein